MTPSWRKPFGMLVMLLAIGAWAVLTVMVIGWVGPLPRLAEPFVYLVTGIVWIWILPMRRLLIWMESGARG